jgi:hypothetical protein
LFSISFFNPNLSYIIIFNLILILLISIFFFYFFVKILLFFNFIIQFKFMVYYFFQFEHHSFDFLALLLKLFFFSISPSNKEFVNSLFFKKNYPQFFNCYFLSFCVIVFFFPSILSFNIWFVKGWTLWFFHVRYLQSNNQSHKFDQLIKIHFLF